MTFYGIYVLHKKSNINLVQGRLPILICWVWVSSIREDIIQKLQVHLKEKNHYHCVTLTNSTSCSPKVHQSGATSCFTRYLICVVIAGRQGSKVIQKPFIQLDLLLLLSIYSVFIRCKTLVFAAYIFLYKDNGLELGLILHSQQVYNNFSSVRTTLFESEYCRGPELYIWRQASLWRVQFWAIYRQTLLRFEPPWSLSNCQIFYMQQLYIPSRVI